MQMEHPHIFTIDNNGNNVTTGNPITLCPTITMLVPSVTFNITSLVDADPNNCEIPITNKSQNVTFSTRFKLRYRPIAYQLPSVQQTL